jgi:uncharacterized protein (TIGR00255 family)
MESMTAYAKSELDWNNLHFSVEIRTLNHRYREAILKLPQKLWALEDNIKYLIENFINRGRVECTVKITGDMEGLSALRINWDVAKAYYCLLKEIKKGLGLDDEISLEMILGVKDIFVTEEDEDNVEELWKPLKQLLEKALVNIKAMRREEGENLKNDIETHLNYITILSAKIKEHLPQVTENYRKHLKQRINELLTSGIDEIRLAQEVVFFAERSDITEEIVRLESHLKTFKELLKKDEPLGRKLDFLLQEMHREINTMGAKANDAFISQKVVEIKTELEKIRQQMQNIE